MKKFIASIILMFTMNTFFNYGQTDTLYLEQTPPGNTPVIFSLETSPGYFPTDRIAISHDGKTIYYSETTGNDWSDCKVKKYECINKSWNGPTVVLVGHYHAPGLSNDNNYLYTEALYQTGNKSYFSIQADTGWDVPVQFPEYYHYYQEANSGAVYAGTNDGISQLIITETDTFFQCIKGPAKSGGGFCVAKDESFMVSTISGNLCVSYRKEDNTWTNPKQFGPEINTSTDEYGAFITSDNKYLFYSRTNASYSDGDIYWVRIDNIIDHMRLTNFIPYLKNNIPDIKDTLGNILSYTIPDTIFFDDDGNETLTLTATLSNGNNLPDSLNFDTETNTISGKLINSGNYDIKIAATDTAGASISDAFRLTVVENPDGLFKSTLDNNISIYPNPANNRIYIKNAEQLKIDYYELTDLSCKIVGFGCLNDNSIDISTFSKGIYILKIRIDDKIINRKIAVE